MGKGRRQLERKERADKRKERDGGSVELTEVELGSLTVSNFNTEHGGIDPEINRRIAAHAAEENAHKGYHWHGPILYNGRHQIVLDWRTYKLVGSGR